jgi:hypothetical protein
MKLEALVAAACKGSKLSRRKVGSLFGDDAVEDLLEAFGELTPSERRVVDSLGLELKSVSCRTEET